MESKINLSHRQFLETIQKLVFNSRNLLTEIKGIKIKVRLVQDPDRQGFPEVSKNSQL